MAKCLDCGFLHLTWKEEESEYSQAERKRLQATPREAHGPRGLGCFRGAIEFPGDPLRRVASFGGPRTAEGVRREQQNREEDAKMIAALEQEWNCELFVPHTPGQKPSEHLALQQSRDWEAHQEQARRAWEKAQQEERQRFQERLIERQERFEAEQRRHDRSIANVAWIVPLIISTIISLAFPILTRYIQIGSQPQFGATAPASPAITATAVLTPTHAVTSTLTLTPTYTPTTLQP